MSTSGYYEWRGRRPSARAIADAELTAVITEIHRNSCGTYGSPRVHAELRLGYRIPVGRNRVERLMRCAGLQGAYRRRHRRGSSDPGVSPHPNLVNRRFAADARDRLWCMDITRHHTDQGWIYCAVVLDAFSRRIVGWSIADHLRAELVCDALDMARWRLRAAAGQTIAHSDHGAQAAFKRSSQHRIVFGEGFGGCLPAERFPGSGVECVGDGCDVARRPARQIGALREVLPQKTIRVLVGAALAGTLRVGAAHHRYRTPRLAVDAHTAPCGRRTGLRASDLAGSHLLRTVLSDVRRRGRSNSSGLDVGAGPGLCGGHRLDLPLGRYPFRVAYLLGRHARGRRRLCLRVVPYPRSESRAPSNPSAGHADGRCRRTAPSGPRRSRPAGADTFGAHSQSRTRDATPARELRRRAAAAGKPGRPGAPGGAIDRARAADLSFAAEIAGARPVLEATGAEVSIDVAPGGPDSRVLAIVLREAVTNIVRHSEADQTSIRVTADERSTRMRITNNRAAPGLPDRQSTGLSNMTIRLNESGGNLATELIRTGSPSLK